MCWCLNGKLKGVHLLGALEGRGHAQDSADEDAAGKGVQGHRLLVDNQPYVFLTVPRPILERLGVESFDAVNLRLADGQVERRAIGEIWGELDGIERPTLCVFGDREGSPIIGAATLETFLFAVDPHGERLVPVEALWMYGI